MKIAARLCTCALAVLAASSPAVRAHTPEASPPAAKPGATVGVVQFANSGAPRAQADFLYGLAQLHNFQYADAAEAFRRAQRADPGFALAYWGEAMTFNHSIWFWQDADAARAVLARLGPDRAARLARAPTERERAYLDAVETLYGEGDKRTRDRRYAAAMRRLHERWPDDVDAAAFYALSLMGTAHDGRDVPTYIQAYAIVQELFPRYPQHPGVAHYLIHSIDDAAHAPLGVKAARAYGKIAPESSHALHMTSHIYLALGLWDDVVAANEAALEVAARRARQKGQVAPDCGHAQMWLNYGYLQQGRYADSKRMIERCLGEVRERPQLEQDAEQLTAEGSSLGSFYTMRLRYLLDGPANDPDVRGWLPDASAVPFAAFVREHSAALDAAHAGPADELRGAVERARAAATRLLASMDAFAVPPQSPSRRIVAIQRAQLDALLRARDGDRDGALAALETAARDEDQLPAAYGPPQVDQPTRELLGALLLDAGRPADARPQFERALVLNPGRVAALRGLQQAARATGDSAEAEAIDARLRQTLAHADRGIAAVR